MLSILIPIYNYNVLPLVNQLSEQCILSGINFEILCQDDASNSIFNVENEKINNIANCSFVALEKNVAHRANRNLLAKKAKYENLLFLDGDSNIINSNYINNYCEYLGDYDAIYGGRVHPKECPSENQKLRWLYGIKVEDKKAIDRNKSIYASLLFNNTVITKALFNKTGFDAEMKLYGHDDTQLSYKFKTQNATVLHIDNPIEHADIDNNELFYNKTKESVKNVKIMHDTQQLDYNYLKILKLYHFLKSSFLYVPIGILYSAFSGVLKNKLIGNKPSILAFNIFRVGYLCSLK